MKQLSIRDVCFIGFTSMITGFFASLIYFHILKKHESYVIAALIYSSPVFTLLISYFVLKEKVSYIGVAGVILIVSGVIMLALNEKGHKHEEFLNAR
jgi:drug/metabolite transporter (DMT)-like permease